MGESLFLFPLSGVITTLKSPEFVADAWKLPLTAAGPKKMALSGIISNVPQVCAWGSLQSVVMGPRDKFASLFAAGLAG